MSATVRLWLLACLGAALLGSCAPLRRPIQDEAPSPPPPAAPEPPPAAVQAPPPTAPDLAARPAAPEVPRRRERENRALELLHKDELARALTQWKLLRTLDPENAEYRKQIAAVQALIHHRFDKHLRAGDQALAAGHPERAQTEYLKALALDPLRTEPLPRLRELERERALAAQTARLAKLRARQGEARTERRGAVAPQAASPGQQERDYLETGISLLQQGAYEESILELEKYLSSFPDDREAQGHLAEARRKLEGAPASAPIPPAPAPPVVSAPPTPHLQAPPVPRSAAAPPAPAVSGEDKALAQELYEKGLRVSRTDLDQAIRYWEESLARDPEHVQTRLQLERALRMQRSLQEIPAQ